MKINDLKTHDEVLAEELRNADFRAEWERTRFADVVATRVITYRAEHGVTQTGLAQQLGMSQSAVARIEAGDHEPTIATLSRLSRRPGMSFHIDITPDHEPELTA